MHISLARVLYDIFFKTHVEFQPGYHLFSRPSAARATPTKDKKASVDFMTMKLSTRDTKRYKVREGQTAKVKSQS